MIKQIIRIFIVSILMCAFMGCAYEPSNNESAFQSSNSIDEVDSIRDIKSDDGTATRVIRFKDGSTKIEQTPSQN